MTTLASSGKFIVFEGGEGSGKTTQLKFLAGVLRERGIPVIETREPGGTPFAEEVRNLLVKGRADKITALSETFLLYAARADHVERVIKPALANGQWVLSDRYFESTFAYQGAAGGVHEAILSGFNDLVVRDAMPDFTILIDVDPNVGLMRAHQRGEETSRFEAKDIDFHNRLRQEYRRRFKSRIDGCSIDGNYPIGDVSKMVLNAVSWMLPAEGVDE